MTAPGSAFERYVAARGGVLLRLAFMLTGNAHAAEDVVQAALVRAYRHWDRVCAAADVDRYVRRIVVNENISQRRRRSSRERPTADLAGTGATPDHADAVGDHDVRPVSASGLIGRWEPVDASNGRAYLRFTAGNYTGSDGCNGVGGRYAVGPGGRILLTSGAYTLAACQNSAVIINFAQTARIGTRGSDLVLYDMAGHVLGRLRHG